MRGSSTLGLLLVRLPLETRWKSKPIDKRDWVNNITGRQNSTSLTIPKSSNQGQFFWFAVSSVRLLSYCGHHWCVGVSRHRHCETWIKRKSFPFDNITNRL